MSKIHMQRKCDQHFASNEIESALDGALCLKSLLLEQDRPYKLVDDLIFANVFEFLQSS